MGIEDTRPQARSWDALRLGVLSATSYFAVSLPAHGARYGPGQGPLRWPRSHGRPAGAAASQPGTLPLGRQTALAADRARRQPEVLFEPDILLLADWVGAIIRSARVVRCGNRVRGPDRACTPLKALHHFVSAYMASTPPAFANAYLRPSGMSPGQPSQEVLVCQHSAEAPARRRRQTCSRPRAAVSQIRQPAQT